MILLLPCLYSTNQLVLHTMAALKNFHWYNVEKDLNKREKVDFLLLLAS
jgi:hypothetical protein